MKQFPKDVMAAVDACFAAGICFDLAVLVNNVPFRIVSDTPTTADVINQYGSYIGKLTKD